MGKYIVGLLGLWLALAGCRGTSALAEAKEAGAQKFVEQSIGERHYAFKQQVYNNGCRFYQIAEAELVAFLEMNHAGDKDDVVPRKVVSIEGIVLSTEKTETHESRFSTKLCMNSEGGIVALHYSGKKDDAIEEALWSLIFEVKEGACVECRTIGFWKIP